MRRHKTLVGLLLAYWATSLAVYGVWETHGWYPVTGDEPHHIIIGRALLHYGSLEQTRAYEDEFAKGFLGRLGDAIVRSNAHVVEGPRGRFSVHSPGTGIIAVLPIEVSEVLGYRDDVPFVKVFFVLLSGATVIAGWVLASLYVKSTPARVLAVLLTCFSLPLVIAANQVFPDLPAGVLAVCVLAWLAVRTHGPTASLWQGVGVMCLVAFLPWLHYKFSAMALVLAVAVLYATFRTGAGWKRLAAMCVAPAIAGALFFLYNDYAFGNPIHFHSSISVHTGGRALMWFFAFNLDRWHGFLLQNPVFFIGLLFLVPFVLRQPLVGVTALLAYLAVTGINAGHASPGYSFAGRHAWTGCLCLMPATIYGLGRLKDLSVRIYSAIGAGLMLLQVLAVAPLVLTKHDLYNPSEAIWFDVYPSFFPEVVNRFLPAFYNPDWWYTHATNYVFILIAAAIVGIGAWCYPRRHERTLQLAGGLLLLAAPAVLIVGLIQPDPPRKPLLFSARSLHRHFGLLQQDTVLASVNAHEAGIWTFGPYIKLAEGEYRVTFRLQSDAQPNVKVGSWDVTARAGRVRLASGEVMGTAGRRGETGGSFQITSAEQGHELETRLFFEDVADVLFVDVLIEPVD